MLPQVKVIPAGLHHQPVMTNLIELYIHDFSEFVAVDVSEDGRFGYENLPLYWSEANHHAYLARVDGKIAGFALVRRTPTSSGDNEVWDMTEFFILRRYRHQGIGGALAQAVWNQHPGDWQVRVMDSNRPALAFWQAAIARFTGASAVAKDSAIDGVRWHVFSFRSSPQNHSRTSTPDL